MRYDLRANDADLNPGQRRFLRSCSKYTLLAGGFGAGKTTALCLKILQLATINRGYPGLVLGPNWGTVMSVIWASMRRILLRAIPHEQIPKLRGGMHERFVDFGDGTIVYLRSAKNVDSFDGLDVAWVAGDEIRHWAHRAYETAIARARIRAPMTQRAFSSTPAFHWMADEWNTRKKGRELIVAPTRENARNLEDDYIPDLERSYSRRMRQAVLEGRFVPLEGAVYEAFDPDPSASPWFTDINAPAMWNNNRVVLALDPGFRRSAVLWTMQTAPTEWVAFDQLMPDSMSMESVVTVINNRRIDGQRVPVDEIWVDPAADATDQLTGMDVLSVLRGIEGRAGGRPPIKMLSGAYRSIEYGVEKTRVLLGDPEIGLPIRLRFDRRLLALEKERGIIKDLTAYQYPELKDGRPITDVPLKDGRTDHSNDALRYFATGMWLTSSLRQLDRELRVAKDPGFRMAA